MKKDRLGRGSAHSEGEAEAPWKEEKFAGCHQQEKFATVTRQAGTSLCDADDLRVGMLWGLGVYVGKVKGNKPPRWRQPVANDELTGNQ